MLNEIETASRVAIAPVSYLPPPPISISRLTGGWLRDAVRVGDVVVDATMSNTVDSIALSKQVGSAGIVYAINSHNCSHNLANNMLGFGGCLHRVSLLTGHYTQMRNRLKTNLVEKIKLVMFNFSSHATDFIPIRSQQPLHIQNVIAGLQGALHFLAYYGFVAMIFDRASASEQRLANHTRIWIRRNSGGRLLFETVKPIVDHQRKLELIVVRKV